MNGWIVYSKDGVSERCVTKKLQYDGEFMGACSVTISITSPSPIDFQLGDYIVYRGERFEINYDPSVIKQSSYQSHGDGFVYENIVFNSLSDELTRCDFLDYVPSDNEIHYSSLPSFSFFADSISKLAERIQVNLDRIYTGDRKWTVVVHPEHVNTTNINISVNNNTVWDALGFVNSKFNANFIIRNRTITIGTTGLAVGQLFSYGKGNGLYKIERNAESNQKIITRIRAYGSTRNMPDEYYNNIEGGGIPNNMAIKNLMLPSFPMITHDPYIDSDNINELGIREGSVFFDGSNELEEIYPTMEGMTAEDLAQAGIMVNATGALDVIKDAEQIKDDGKFEIPEGESEVEIPAFTITLKDIGFDINDYLSTTSATISMKDGMCGGRDFEIVKCEKSGNDYVLTCNRHYDEGLDLYFPYSSFQIKSGDKYVLLNIEMPDVYIQAASQRLFVAAKNYLAKNDYVRYSYTPSIDNIFMARQHDEAIKYNTTSIHDTIKEGDLMLFEDTDLGVSGSITIASLSIKENAEESLIPEYEITLKDEKTVGTIERIQNQISSIISGSAGVGNGSLSSEQIQSIIAAYGSKIFLRKDKDDRSKGKISSDKAIEVGKFVAGASGAIIQMDKNTGQTVAEMDKLYVRMKAYFDTLEIINVNSVGGKQILSPSGAIRCIGVEDRLIVEDEEGNKTETVWPYYRCYFLAEQDGEKIENRFVSGDQAYSEMFNAEEGVSNNISNHYYWRLVVGVSLQAVTFDNKQCHYIDLSKTDCDSGSDAPKVGDVINHRGNRTNVDRQNFIEFSSVGVNAPYITLFQGVNSYSLANKDYVSFGYDQSTGQSYMNVYGRMFIGKRDESSYLKYTPENGLELKGKLAVGTTLNGKDLEELIKASSPEGYQEFVDKVTQDIDNLQNQIDGAIESYFFEYDPTTGNYPALEWDTDSEKEAHLGDTFTNNLTGDSWRWGLDSRGNYAWIYIEDTATKKALAAASQAKDTADSKRRIFVTQPYTPYDEGDLWSRGKEHPLMVCIFSRSTGSFVESDWDYADNNEQLKNEMQELVSNTKSELDKAITDAEEASKDYTDEAKTEIQKSIDAINQAKANIEDVYDKATVDGIVDQKEADAIRKANEVAQAERELLELRVKAYADGKITESEQRAIDEAQKRVDEAKGELEQELENLETELRTLINSTASNLNTAIDNAKKAANEYTDEAKTDLQSSINELESAKANLVDVYSKSQADEKISQAEEDAINAAANAANLAIQVADEQIRAWADGELTKEEEARIKQAQENLEAAKKYAEEKAQEAFDNAMSELADYDYLKQALKEDTSTTGGLIQSSLLKLGYTSSSGYVVMAGSNGALVSSLGDKTIAFWAGGQMLDRENGYASNVNAADFLVRMDGSGYAASGNLSWDVTGKVTANPLSFFVGEDTVGALLSAFNVTAGTGGLASLIEPLANFTHLNVNNSITINGKELKYDATKNYWKLEGNLLVTGAVTMYANEGTYTPSTIMDAIAVDGTTISKSGGVLKVIGGTSGTVGATSMGALSNVGAWANSVADVDRIMYQATGSSNWVSKPLSDIVGKIKPVKIWGQSFDGTGDVSGDLFLGTKVIRGNSNLDIINSIGNWVIVGNGIAESGYITYIDGNEVRLRYGTNHSNGLILNSSGNVGIGTVSPAYKLDVNGDSYFRGNVSIPSTYGYSLSVGLAQIPSNGDRITFNTLTGTYTKGILAMNSNNAYISAPLKTDSATGERVPILFEWRDGTQAITISSNNVTTIHGSAVINNLLTANGGITANGNVTVNNGDTVTGKIYPKENETIDLGNSARHWYNVHTKYINGGTPWTSLNDGSGSGLDADMLDGVQMDELSRFIFASNNTYLLQETDDLNALTYEYNKLGFYVTKDNTSYTNAPYQNFSLWAFSLNSYYTGQLIFPYDVKGGRELLYRSQRYDVGGYAWSDWKTIAFIDSNVASATKLQTPRKIWGQSFDGTGDVSGDLFLGTKVIRGNSNLDIINSIGNWVIVGNGIAESGYITYIDGNEVRLRYGTNHSNGLILNSSGNVGIGTVSPAYKLDVNGDSCFRGNVSIPSTYGYSLSVGLVQIPSNGDRITFNTLTGTYTKGILAMNSNNAYISAPLKTDSATGERVPILFEWRDGTQAITISSNNVTTIHGSAVINNLLTANGGITANGNVTVNNGNMIDCYGNGWFYHLYPQSTNNYNLGNSSSRWAALYVGSADLTGSITVKGSVITNDIHGNGNALYLGNSNNSSWVYLREDMGGNSASLGQNWTIRVSGASTFTSLSLTGNESNNIASVYNDNNAITTNAPTSLASIRHALSFKWHSTDWQIGNIRGSSADTQGFGITSGNSTLCFRVQVGQSTCYGNFLVSGGVTMHSQRSLKNIINENGLSLRELEFIKPTRYTWKDGRDNKLHIGGIADDIQQVLPEVIYKTDDGTLSMDYGNAAFAIAASLIKPVVDHERRIALLEKENEELKKELNRLKCA